MIEGEVEADSSTRQYLHRRAMRVLLFGAKALKLIPKRLIFRVLDEEATDVLAL